MRNGEIVYVSLRGRNRANWLYVMAQNGAQQRPLGHARRVSTPAWSPDSRWLLYVGKSSLHCVPGGDLYLMRADGTHVRRLTHDGRCYSDPTWAPDGRRIAYVSVSKSELPTIWTMNLNGTGRRQLTSPGPPGTDNPAWSPDGRTIAFRSGFPPAIWLMDADGGNQRQLTMPERRPRARSDEDAQPAWSPNGKRIAFARLHPSSGAWRWDIYAIRSDGSGLQQLTDRVGLANLGPDWSPDGTRIAFVSDRAHRDLGDIYVMKANGTNQTRLTRRGIDNHSPDWRPLRARGASRSVALSVSAGIWSVAGKAKPVKPRTLAIVNDFIQSFAQSGDAVSWIDWRDRVYVKRLSKPARSFVGSALGNGNRATLEYRPLLTLVGTRAFWTTYDGGNSVEIAIYVSAPGKKRSLIDVIGSNPDGSGTGGYFPSLVSDGPRLVYGYALVYVPGGGWPTDCTQLALGGQGVKVIAGPPYGYAHSVRIPAMPSVMMLDASQGRVAVVPATWQVPPGERCPGLAVGENGPVEVYDLEGRRLARVVPVGTVEAVALSWPQLAVLVRRHEGTKAIERYDAHTGALLRSIAVSSKVSEISIGTRGVAYSAGSSIYLLSANKPRLVWRSTGAPIGVSIEGSRIAWAVNGRPSLVRALTMP